MDDQPLPHGTGDIPLSSSRNQLHNFARCRLHRPTHHPLPVLVGDSNDSHSSRWVNNSAWVSDARMHITEYPYNGKYKISSGLSEKAVGRAALKQLVFKMKRMGLLVSLLLAATLLSSTSDAAPAPSLVEKITAKLAAKGLGAGLGIGSGLASAFSRPSLAVVAPVPVLAVPVTRTVVTRTRTTSFG